MVLNLSYTFPTFPTLSILYSPTLFHPKDAITYADVAGYAGPFHSTSTYMFYPVILWTLIKVLASVASIWLSIFTMLPIHTMVSAC
jgi:hypothetical protein